VHHRPKRRLISLFCVAFAWASPAAARPVIVAAEDFYGQIAAEIGGTEVDVFSVLTNPAEDPHLYEPSASTARLLAGATVAIANGAGFDPWMTRLMQATPSATRRDIVVADALHTAPGADPHLWYQPRAALAVAAQITGALVSQDRAHAGIYLNNLNKVQREIGGVQGAIAALKKFRGGAPIAETEPVFSYMADALGLTMRDTRFATSIMNGTEPRASDVAELEADIRQHKIRVLIYNAQASTPAVTRLLGIAKTAGVPVVGVTETMPANATYVGWMRGQLDALAAALAQK
jgi:zinc/manganese transport system substrate-binding protein